MFEELIIARKDNLFHYSPFNFIRSEERSRIIATEIVKIQSNLDSNLFWRCNIVGDEYVFIYNFLDWDTAFFKLKTYKLYTVLYGNERKNLKKAIVLFQKFLKYECHCEYLFIEIPSEDTILIQALGNCSFSLIETRLNYCHNAVNHFSHTERYNVREATIEDIPRLKLTATTMRNDFDRFHADSIFSQEVADAFLSKYIEEAVNGFADIVLVPAEQETAPDSFLTAKYYKEDWKMLANARPSKMILSAVSSQTNKGWYIKLISEMMYVFKNNGVTHVFLNTQSTNRQVFHTWEKLGFKLGFTTHVFSWNTLI